MIVPIESEIYIFLQKKWLFLVHYREGTPAKSPLFPVAWAVRAAGVIWLSDVVAETEGAFGFQNDDRTEKVC